MFGRAYGKKAAFVTLWIVGSASFAYSQDKPTIELINPDAKLMDLNVQGNTCYIVIRGGKNYRVCNFKLPIELETQLKELEQK